MKKKVKKKKVNKEKVIEYYYMDLCEHNGFEVASEYSWDAKKPVAQSVKLNIYSMDARQEVSFSGHVVIYKDELVDMLKKLNQMS